MGSVSSIRVAPVHETARRFIHFDKRAFDRVELLQNSDDSDSITVLAGFSYARPAMRGGGMASSATDKILARELGRLGGFASGLVARLMPCNVGSFSFDVPASAAHAAAVVEQVQIGRAHV